MENEKKERSAAWNIILWILSLIFIALGVLNFIYIHPVPGIFYVVLSLFYLPPFGSYLKKKIRFSIPLIALLIIAFLVLWATLGVGDLMEMFEDSIPNL